MIDAGVKHRFSHSGGLPSDLMDADYCEIGFYDAAYPQLLKHIPDPPLVLFCLGNLAVLEQCCVALVGARKSTESGRAMAQSLLRSWCCEAVP